MTTTPDESKPADPKKPAREKPATVSGEAHTWREVPVNGARECTGCGAAWTVGEPEPNGPCSLPRWFWSSEVARGSRYSCPSCGTAAGSLTHWREPREPTELDRASSPPANRVPPGIKYLASAVGTWFDRLCELESEGRSIRSWERPLVSAWHACVNDFAEDATVEKPAKDPSGQWRTGAKVGRTLYLDDKLVGMLDTAELAQEVARMMNGEPKDPRARRLEENSPTEPLATEPGVVSEIRAWLNDPTAQHSFTLWPKAAYPLVEHFDRAPSAPATSGHSTETQSTFGPPVGFVGRFDTRYPDVEQRVELNEPTILSCRCHDAEHGHDGRCGNGPATDFMLSGWLDSVVLCELCIPKPLGTSAPQNQGST